MRACPICGSAQLVPVRHGAHRTDGSLALAGTDIDEWVCGDCGHRFEGDPHPEAALIPFPAPRPELDPEPVPAAAEPGPGLGGTLRRAREQLGLGLEEAAEATGIWPRHLRALEEDEPPEAFPGVAYARLYLRGLRRLPRSGPRAAPARAGLRVVLEMREPCWIGATVDGERRVSRTAAPGERVVLRGERSVELVLGNGGGVVLRVNGERVPTGAHGEVVRLTFRLHDGVVRTERA